MNPHYEDDNATVWHGDCLDVLREMPDSSIDAIVTDPPYGLGFMGKDWDDLPPGLPWAQECLRVLKPGGHLLAFGGTRTWHRLAVAVEDAGFEVRDSIAWLYGSGFPKSLDVSKAIDKAAGATREVVGTKLGQPGYSLAPSKGTGHLRFGGFGGDGNPEREAEITAPATPAAQQWQGWGTALKPAFEPIVVARKPLVGTVAQTVLAHGTGALNVDATRIPTDDDRRRNAAGGDNGLNGEGTFRIRERRAKDQPITAGRWPTNVVLDGDAAAELDEQSGTLKSGDLKPYRNANRDSYSGGMPEVREVERAGDSGGASRFFPVFRYQAKAPTRERPTVVAEDGTKTAHPTVKPLALMRWLVRLVTPPGGVVLDPFAGSGTTIEAAILEGFQVIGIEREADYLPLIEARIERNRITAEGVPAVVETLSLFDLLDDDGDAA